MASMFVINCCIELIKLLKARLGGKSIAKSSTSYCRSPTVTREPVLRCLILCTSSLLTASSNEQNKAKQMHKKIYFLPITDECWMN